MAHLIQLDPTQAKLSFGEFTAQLTGPQADLLVEALVSMLPAEKVPMMAPPTTRGYTLTAIEPTDYAALVTLINQVNTTFQAEVLKTNSRAREGSPLQAKILLGEKTIVRGVVIINS
jgi:hypothetical protein